MPCCLDTSAMTITTNTVLVAKIIGNRDNNMSFRIAYIVRSLKKTHVLFT